MLTATRVSHVMKVSLLRDISLCVGQVLFKKRIHMIDVTGQHRDRTPLAHEECVMPRHAMLIGACSGFAEVMHAACMLSSRQISAIPLATTG